MTITPRAAAGWTVRTAGRNTIMDAVQLEDQMEAWAFYGYRELAA